MKTAIIIPARMASKRFPNKPMALINGIPMIQMVWEKAQSTSCEDVYVACSEKIVFDTIINLGGKAIMTDPNLSSGTDRIYSALKEIQNYNKFESIINLQGDMPLIDSKDILKVNDPIINGFDIGTLGTNLSSKEESNFNITKVKIDWIKRMYIGNATDFYKKPKGYLKNIYHHVGIYSYTIDSLSKFVSMKPSSNEIDYKLEQWRALDANMSIGVSYVNNVPISVDTKEDLIQIENIIKSN